MNKIIEGLKEAVLHAKGHGGCQHKWTKPLRPGKSKCLVCGCVLYDSFEDYIRHDG